MTGFPTRNLPALMPSRRSTALIRKIFPAVAAATTGAVGLMRGGKKGHRSITRRNRHSRQESLLHLSQAASGIKGVPFCPFQAASGIKGVLFCSFSAPFLVTLFRDRRAGSQRTGLADTIEFHNIVICYNKKVDSRCGISLDSIAKLNRP